MRKLVKRTPRVCEQPFDKEILGTTHGLSHLSRSQEYRCDYTSKDTTNVNKRGQKK